MLFARLKGGALVLQVPLTKQHVKRAVLQISFISVPLKSVTILAAVLEDDFFVINVLRFRSMGAFT